MPDTVPADSVGLVSPNTLHIPTPITLESGRSLAHYDLIYETYGVLNSDASNAILICHALSGDHHAAGYHSMKDKKPGWWDGYIGPGKTIDTNYFFVVSMNNIGGCAGSSGPKSIDPETGKPYGPDFPIVTVLDWVTTQAELADHLNIKQWAAVIGGSLVVCRRCSGQLAILNDCVMSLSLRRHQSCQHKILPSTKSLGQPLNLILISIMAIMMNITPYLAKVWGLRVC